MSCMSPQETLNQANLDYFVNKNKNNPNCRTDSDVMNRALIDLEIHQAMQKYQMLTNQFDDLSRLPNGKEKGGEVHNKVHVAMTEWVNNRDFKYIEVKQRIGIKKEPLLMLRIGGKVKMQVVWIFI